MLVLLRSVKLQASFIDNSNNGNFCKPSSSGFHLMFQGRLLSKLLYWKESQHKLSASFN